ncbi:hypothetical protein GCM10011351_00910 [Paraliobacillus quinghaiensis]|uniref:Uncharacterized protein n=1 Tax=Paraliobacillus quinghaiensis TaxID=470815 RepID=A0A917TDR5_9BACI|nr:hypothetical protein [Paraliobacillus quinghaiensis]GGM18965.1 hypothetical protein GCM10011351_00910 [Paraliobacillus quinghaiensis]
MSKKDLNKMEFNKQNEEASYNASLEVQQEEGYQDKRYRKNARATASVEPNYPRIDTGNI